MYVMLLLGSIVSALIFGALLANFTPGRLVQVIQGCGRRHPCAQWHRRVEAGGARPVQARAAAGNRTRASRNPGPASSPGDKALRRLMAVGLGTLAFSMQDVMLEPYGGQILGLDRVAHDAADGRDGRAAAWSGSASPPTCSSRGFDAVPHGLLSAPWLAFRPSCMVIAAAPLRICRLLFGLGTLLIGFGAGLFGHGTLTATMNYAPPDQRGLALGAWGAVQATAAGIGVALGGIIRDVLLAAGPAGAGTALTPYVSVYVIEVILLLTAIVVMFQLVRRPDLRSNAEPTAPPRTPRPTRRATAPCCRASTRENSRSAPCR